MPETPARTDPAHLGDGAAPEASVGADAPAPETPEAPRRGRARRWSGRLAKGLAWGLGAVLLVAVGVALFLQTQAGRDLVRGQIVAQLANTFADDAEVTVAGVGGDFLTGARVTGLDVSRNGQTVLSVDSLFVDYNLTTLLRRTFSASDLLIVGPRLVVRQRADGTFDTDGLLAEQEDTGGAGLALRIDRLGVRRGAADLYWYTASGRDSVLSVRDTDVLVLDVRRGEDVLEGTIEALALRALAPDGAAELALEAAGAFSAEALTLDRLALTSAAGTEVSGEAEVRFVGGRALPVFDALVEAAPLALADVRAFSGAPVFGDPRLRLRVDSDGTLLAASLTGALDEATVALDAELTRDPDGGPVRYQAEGTLRRFNPSDVLGEGAPTAEVTGDLRVDLEGTSLESLRGAFAVALRESRVGEQAIDRLRLDGEVAAGRVLFDVEGALPGAALVAEGRARPFDDVPTFQLAGVAEDVDLAVLLPGSGRTDAFAGEFAVVGRGASPETFSGTVALDLTRAEIGLPDRRLAFSRVLLDADISRGEAAFDTDVTLADGGGRLAALGTLSLGEPLRYEVSAGRLTNLDVAALTGDPAQASDLTGTFSVAGRGTDLATAPIDVAVELRDSQFGTYRIDAGSAEGTLRDGLATFTAAADFGPGGAVTASGTARPFDDPLGYQLEGTMRNLDLGALQNNPDQYSDLTGAFRAQGTGLDPETLTLTADLRITEPSSYGDRLVDAAALDVRLSNGELSVDGDVRTPDGDLALALSGRPFGAGAGFTFRDTRFRGLDLSGFAPSAPRTDLTGAFSGSIAGLDSLAIASGRGTLTLDRSRVNDAEIEEGSVVFALDRGALDATVEATLAPRGEGTGGRVVAEIQARPFAETPTYAVRGETEALDVAALLDLPPDQPVRVTTAFEVTGRGADPETLVLQASVSGGGSAVGPLAVEDLRAEFALADGVLRVDTLVVDTDAVRASGGGTVALFTAEAASDFRLAGEVESLAPFAAQTERALGLDTGTFSVVVEGRPREPFRIVGTAEARQIIVDDVAVTGVDASVAGTWDRAAPDSLGLAAALGGSARASFDVLATPTARVQEGDVTVRAAGGTFAIDAAVVLDEGRDLEVGARFDPTTEGIRVERGRLRLQGTTWELLQQAEVSLVGDAVDVRGLILATADGRRQVAADGIVDFAGEQSLIVTAEAVPIGGLTDLAGLDALGGELSAELLLTGPAAAPLISGDVRLAGITSRGRPVGSLRTSVDYADGRLGLDATVTHVEGETLVVGGSIPFQFTLVDGPRTTDAEARAEVDLAARAAAFPIAWARPFLDDEAYTALGGTLALDLQITGTQAAPVLEGQATLSDGRLGVAATGLVYEPIVADVTFRKDRIVLDAVRILDAQGRTALDVTGNIRLQQLSVGELDLEVVPRGFVAMDTRTYDRLVLDNGPRPLQLSGTLDAPVLRGSVVLASGDIYLTDELTAAAVADVALTADQIREVESRFGRTVTARDTATSRFVDALDYDLDVVIRQNVWIRSQANLPFDIEFEGTVAARKEPFAEESQLFGEIEFVRGTVETLSRQFELDEGDIRFAGSPLSADVNLAATLDVRLPGSVGGRQSATVTLLAVGRLDRDFEVRLTADPAMEPADIVSLIATGQLADDIVGAGAAQGLGLGLLAGYGSGLAEGFASRSLGLSLAQIEYEGGDLVIKFGDYLSNKLFWTAGFVVPLGETTQGAERVPLQLSLDYELRRWLAAQAEYSGRRGVGGGLNVEVAW